MTFLIGCTRVDNIRSLGEAEYYFNEKLSSISVDVDKTLWVGSETGDVVNFGKHKIVSYDLGEDRIYKISRYDAINYPSKFWIGVRNAGLQQWDLSKEKQLKEKVFKIKFKEERYSTYDFIFLKDSIYAATSQGVYTQKITNQTDTLELLYPSEEVLKQQNGYSFIVRNLANYQSKLILAATQDGLLFHQINSGEQFTVLKNKMVDYVTIYRDTIYALSEGNLYLLNEFGHILKRIAVANMAKVYYQIEGVHYFIGTQEVLLSNDLEEFTSFKLRRSIPLGSRNIIASDTLMHFTYLLTENAVWRLANHIDLSKGSNSIQQTTSSGNTKYYLDQENQLYVQFEGSKKADWLYSFPTKDAIQWMQHLDNAIYYYTAANELKKVRLSNNKLKNNLFNTPKLIFKSVAKITSCILKKHGEHKFAYLGIQDGLLKINEENKVDTLTQFNDKYITSIFSHDYTDKLYLSTLNHGVFYLGINNDVELIEPTDHRAFINDVITTNDYANTLILLTNHKIVALSPSDSITVKGYNKLIYANDSLFYGLPEYGIHKFKLSGGKLYSCGKYYNDIHFNKWASVAVNNKLFLGSNLGVLELVIDDESTSSWVAIAAPIPFNWYYLLFAVVLVGITLFFTFRFAFHKRMNSQKYISQQKEDLLNRLNELDNFYKLLIQEDSQAIKELLVRIEQIDVDEKDRKRLKQTINSISLEIINLNREATLMLPQKIDHQIDLINATPFFDKFRLLQQTDTAKRANDIELIKNQVIINDEWLQRAMIFRKELSDALDTLKGALELEGVTKGLYASLRTILKEQERTPLDQLTSLLEEQLEQFNFVFTEDALRLINSHIENLQAKLQQQPEQYLAIIEALKSSLEEAKQVVSPDDRFTLLCMLEDITNQVLILEDIATLKNAMIKYKKKRKELVLKNDELINKKFDAELDNYIAEQTQDNVEEIEQLINELYHFVELTDQTVLVDILNLNNYYGQQPKVLALLLADIKVKRTLVPGMLGVYGNLNPVISRLINSRIKVSKAELESYASRRKIPSVFVTLVLQLLD